MLTTVGAWGRERWVPLAVGGLLVAVAFANSTLGPGLPRGPFDIWETPGDLWGAWLTAAAMIHGHFQAQYANDPGAVLLMVPVAWPGHALGLTVGPDFTAYFAPTGWLIAGPYTLAVACLPLFAADAFARRWGFGTARRLVLALVEAAALWNVTWWGHCEDAVAVGLILFALLRVRRRDWAGVGWLLGFATLAQPFALLAVPTFAVMAHGSSPRIDGWRHAWRVTWRAGCPYVASLVPALVFAWGTTTRWLLHQPNWPALNHPTPFTSLSAPVPHSFGGVSSGPGRMVALVAAVALALVVMRRRPADERVALWTVAASFAVWVGVESVVDVYYVWPTLALAVLLAARAGRGRLAATAAVVLVASWFAGIHPSGVYLWWSLMMALLVMVLALTWPARWLEEPATGIAGRATPLVPASAGT